MDNVTRLLMQGAAGAGGEGTYVDDVFSTYLWRGDAQSGRVIENGIKLGNANAGTSVSFDGSGDYLSIPDSTAWDIGTNYTAECFFYIDQIMGAGWDAIIGQWPGSNNASTNTWVLEYVGASTLYFYYNDGSQSMQNVSLGNVSLGAWHHFAFSKEGSNTRLFIDGNLTQTITPTYYDGNGSFNIGGNVAGGGWINGNVSNVRITKDQALYTSNFTPSTQALTTTSQGAIASNVKLLCCNKDTVTGSTVTPGTITAFGQAETSNFGAFTADDAEGGMVWIKARTGGGYGHRLVDTVRGATKALESYDPTAEATESNGLTSFNNNGFTVGSQGHYNGNGFDMASWTWRKQKGFFDIVTYTGNGSNRTIDHSLASVPGMIFVKNRDDGSEWWAAYHRYVNVGADPEQYYLRLNDNNAQATSADLWNNTAPTSTNFSLGSGNAVNKNGDNYVAYVFAGGASTATGARSVEFETASSEFLNIPTSSSDMEMGTSDFTIEAWIFPQDQDTANFNCIFTCNTDFQLTWKERALKFYAPGISLTTGETYRVRQWHHVAVTRSGNTFRLFVNGELKDEGTSSSAIPGLSGYYPSIGAKNSSSDHFWGRISNLRLVKGTALYTSDFTPSTKPLTSVTNTKLLCCNGSTVTSATVTPATLNSSGSPVARPDSPFDDSAGFKFGDSNEGIIKCGHYNGSGSNNSDVYIGWEPSWVMTKPISNTGHWTIFDNMRGVFTGSNDNMLRANLSSDENSNFDQIEFTPTGFRLQGAYVNSGGTKYVYIAIRRSDGYVGKPVEDATKVFAMDMGNGSSTIPAYDSGFPVDFMFEKKINNNTNWYASSRLSGDKFLYPNSSSAEVNGGGDYIFDSNVGAVVGSWTNGHQGWMWKRHAGFDVVCYGGNYTAGRGVPHNLGQVPEMIWVKKRSSSSDGNWSVYHKGLNGGTNPEDYYINLNTNDAEINNIYRWNDTPHNSTHFTLGTSGSVNDSGQTYIAMLFASVPGISKCGSFTGNSSDQTLDLGFQPRLFIVKKYSATGHWYVFDTLRGISNSNAAGDARIQLDQTEAQNTSFDCLDLTSTGVTLHNPGSWFNESGDKYIYYAHA